jgi:signal transduction histidine kinase
MVQKYSTEKRPFRLVKFFTFSSLVVMFTATIALSAINTHWVKRILQQKNEEYAHLLVENLNHQVFLQFIIPVVLKYGKVQLREKSQYTRMDRVIRSTIHSFNVEMVNIYDLKNIISYSLDKDKIGKQEAGGTAYDKAIENKFTSNLVRTGNFFQLLLGIPNTTRIVTFAPLRAEKPLSAISGPVLGVMEIVQDVSLDYEKIFKLQLLIVISCTIIMGSLFFVLRFVVKQGEIIIEKRAEERLKLEEKLQRAEHLSAIGEMTAGVSHEIRNPLGIIKSSAELLQKKMTKLKESTTIVDIILEESVRLNNIIRDFLDFARPMTPELKPCSIEDLIEKNLHFITQQAQEKNIFFNKQIHGNIPLIMGDANRLYQAFLNILLNALQAMPREKTILITLSADRTHVHLTIKDEGHGIDPEHLKKIWTPFFTTKELGTGLGLGIVKNIIESHRGNIHISNAHPTGTKVDISLPITET